jgi:hypothetical protein
MSDTTLFLDSDPVTGRVRTFHALPDGRFAVDSAVDVEPILEENKDLARLQDTKWQDNDNLVARIPMPIYMALRKTWREQGLSALDRQRAMHRFLNDPDNKLFRVKAGKL